MRAWIIVTRRQFLAGGGLVAAAVFVPRWLGGGSVGSSVTEDAMPFDVSRSDAEWRERLTPQQYNVLRGHGTERPYTSLLLEENRPGVFACAGCDLDLYASDTKYDSRTGWPSFWAALDDAVGTSEDRSLGMVRTEVHCARCGGHLGHIFEDGPPPTGLRHCINGVALTFKPAST